MRQPASYIGERYSEDRNRNAILAPNVLRKLEQAPNAWDGCLSVEYELWDELVACGNLEKFCCPKGRKKYSVRPWIAMPAEGRRFKPVGILPVPAPAGFNGLDTLIPFGGTADGTLVVPVGYDGVITDTVCEITANGGTGFVEGSGDLTWRLSANGRFLRDMGNILVTEGSLTTPSPVPRGGLRVFSQDVIKFTVAFAVGADARINPAANVIVSVTGWFYPR
jgi:hypothetical protein